MPIMKPPFEQLKEKLKEIFQLDRSDLDFGIYRILNIKSAEIERFLEVPEKKDKKHKGLLNQVHKVLQEYQNKDVSTLQADLDRAISGAKAAGVDPANAPTVQAINKQIALLGGNIDERAKVVFSDLYNFFRRYYKDGDFLSLRRYKKDVYALPYEGEEVKLHWANADQYYVKSSEKFGRYVFRAGDKRITLEIAAADTERDNNKANGKTLRYLPLPNEEDELFTIQGAQMNIRFACTPTDDRRQQETINECTARKLIKEMTKEWQEPLEQPAPTKANEFRILLHKHINTFTAKNTFDYFIHKDLRGFLRRELDFYIKNEVMLLDDIEEAEAPAADVWLGRAFALRKVGHKIIDFLAQMENFQKRLWLKKKFVLQTHYCAALGHLPLATMPKLLTRILDNEAQWAEWKSLGIVRNNDFAGGDAQQKREEFLRQNPSLPVDTRHFDKNFQYELLAGYDNLDEVCDGVLIHGENFQALNLLSAKYRERVKCVYIDPPYNTGNDSFIYKDNYKYSSWLSMLYDRLSMSRIMMCEDGIIFSNIGDLNPDEGANFRLQFLMSNIFPKRFGNLIWKKRASIGSFSEKDMTEIHEYILAHGNHDAYIYKNVLCTARKAQFDQQDKDGRLFRWMGLIGPAQQTKSRRPNLDYIILYDKGLKKIVGFQYKDAKGNLQTDYFDADKSNSIFSISLGGTATWLIGKDVMMKFWNQGIIRVVASSQDYRVEIKNYLISEDGTVNGTILKSILNENGIRVGMNRDATGEINSLFFPQNYTEIKPKPTSLIKFILSTVSINNEIILDYFAGSGTTAHAVINLNREDGGRRKFILAEMGEHFETVLLPRIKKIMYAPEWKDGEPKQKATDEEFEYGPRLIKYQCIESYEDALDNLQDKPPDAPRAKESFANQAMREDYMLHYFLDVETKDSASLLNVESMAAYDKYHLHITREGKTEKMPIDLVETFNYLLGLRVAKMRCEREVLMIEGQNPQGDNVLVIWRDANTMSAEQLSEWFRAVEINLHNNEYDIIYINGDNLVESLRLSDEVWKVRSTEKEFRHLMFEDTD